MDPELCLRRKLHLQRVGVAFGHHTMESDQVQPGPRHQPTIPALLSAGGDSLFFTGASGSLRGMANYAPFAAAKAALRALAQSLAREFGPQIVHVGHVIIDGGIAGQRLLSKRPGLVEQRGPDGLLKIEAIAEAYWTLHNQQRSAWTLEMDLRPWTESF